MTSPRTKPLIKLPAQPVQAAAPANALAAALQPRTPPSPPSMQSELLAPQRTEPRIRAAIPARLREPRAPRIKPAHPGRGFNY